MIAELPQSGGVEKAFPPVRRKKTDPVTGQKPIHPGIPAEELAIIPDGKSLYAATQNKVVPISTATNMADKSIRTGYYGFPDGMIITP